MAIISLTTLFVFVLVLSIFILLPPRYRDYSLLTGSAVVLAIADLRSFWICLGQIAAAFFLAGWIYRNRASVFRIWVSVLLTLAPLGFFKFRTSTEFLFETTIVPIGLSVYTFQFLSYLIDVRRGVRNPENSPFRLLMYGLLFVNKINGPVENSQFIDQIRVRALPDRASLFRSGLLIWFGFFQKFVIAAHLGAFTAPALQDPKGHFGLPVSLAAFVVKYQLFCDFSGGSLIALGLGGFFGLKMTNNFNRPFAATSLAEFWKRWHISLQRWIREYVFLPLLGTRLANLSLFFPLLLTFIIFATWHGIAWTFVCYGALQAVLLWVRPERLWVRWLPFGVFVAVANYAILLALPGVLFQAEGLRQAWDVWSNMSLNFENWIPFYETHRSSLAIGLIMIPLHETVLWAEEKYRISHKISVAHWTVRATMTIVLLASLFLLAKFGEVDFIYSRF